MPRTCPKPTAALERCARQIKDSDEFVAHVANIAARYRREHAMSNGARASEVRNALRDFDKHAVAIIDWLNAAQRLSVTHQGVALEQISTILYGTTNHARAAGKPVCEWLAQAHSAAQRCLVAKPADRPNAPRIAAAALRATFEHHKLKWSTAVTKQTQSDAVRLLLAIAKSGGDAALTVEAARTALRNVDAGARR